MKKNNKIIDYFSGNLSEKEKTELLEEIKNSADLFEDFKAAEKLFSDIKDLKEIKLNQNYSENILPRFRNRLSEKNIYFQKPAFTFAAALSVSLILFFIFYPDQNLNNNIENLDNLSEAETITLVDELYNDFTLSEAIDLEENSDLLINNLIIKELELSSADENPFNTDQILNLEDINQIEAEKIYSEIINKKFF